MKVAERVKRFGIHGDSPKALPASATIFPQPCGAHDNKSSRLPKHYEFAAYACDIRAYFDGEFYKHDEKKDKGEKKAVFRGSLPETGRYEVRISYPVKSNLDKNVPVTIEAVDGVHEIRLDQTRKPAVAGLFEPIGRFDFEKGRSAIITIGTHGTKDYVTVDAVQFISEKDIERESAAIAKVDDDEDVDPILKMDSAALAKELDKQIGELKDADLAMAPRELPNADDIHLRIRGEVTQLAPKVPRGFPGVLYNGPPVFIEPGTSGRRELAEWMVADENILLDRVIVNRVWAQLFGHGIVGTVDNFGVQGDKPTHPELLDSLAANFRANGGSIKQLIREMVLSRTYQLASEGKSSRTLSDSENQWFSRHSIRRLDAEEIRDSLLYFSDELDLKQAEATANSLGVDLDKPLKLESFKKRSVYIPVARNNLAPEMEIFDTANPEMTTGDRPLTTVPTQSLYLLNSPFISQRSAKLAQNAYSQPNAFDWMHRRVIGRPPSKLMTERASEFIESSSEDRQKAFADLSHVLFASTEFLFLE